MGFLKGRIPWNKGVKTGLVPKTAFKKGCEVWNKGLAGTGLVKAWNKGKVDESGCARGYVLVSSVYGQIRRSHLIVQDIIGILIKSKEVIHHINGKKNDDREVNLFLFRHQSAHKRWHHFLARHGIKGEVLEFNLSYL
jgi:hypothetical protein